MKKRSSIWADPSLWLLAGVNAWLVWYYYRRPQIFTTLVWLYWAQSVSLGVFNFLDLLTAGKNTEPFVINDKPVAAVTANIVAAFFFLLHYGVFHLVYLALIVGMKSSGPFDPDLFRYALAAFVFGQLISFIQRKIRQSKVKTNITYMFFRPYLRIIPMHLTILAPAFFHVGREGIFLVLKAITDVAMHMVMPSSKNSREMDATALASQSVRV